MEVRQVGRSCCDDWNGEGVGGKVGRIDLENGLGEWTRRMDGRKVGGENKIGGAAR